MEDSNLSYSKDESILKKFDIPERKAKIESIFKMKSNAPVYCTCKSTDVSRFMICCEKCEEWYHGDCIHMKEKESKYIKKWYCHKCVDKYKLEVVYVPKIKKSSSKKKKKEKKHRHHEKQECFFSEKSQCGRCSNCHHNKEFSNKKYQTNENHRVHQACKSEEDFTLPRTTNATVTQNGGYTASRHKHERSFKNADRQKQCIGPRCTNSARPNSKYCTEECGLALAKKRILSILPYQVNKQAETPCVADQHDKEKLDTIKLQKNFIVEALKKLDHKEMKLLDLISQCKQVPVVDSKEEDDESKMFCFTCGWEIPGRSAERHMEVCFRKVESQYAFAGPHKANPECKIFCEYYDKGKYCKQLRFACTDHFKPMKTEENEVCGCPIKGLQNISPDIFAGAEKFCQHRKKDCDQHFNWELLARSEIDFHRLQEWIKFNKLVDEEANIKKQREKRLGVLGLLLHSTVSHHRYFSV